MRSDCDVLTSANVSLLLAMPLAFASTGNTEIQGGLIRQHRAFNTNDAWVAITISSTFNCQRLDQLHKLLVPIHKVFNIGKDVADMPDSTVMQNQ
jgi:hypothetical protein